MKAKNTGKPFENSIKQQCDLYEAKGIARIKKTGPDTRHVYYKGKMELVYLKGNEWLDFAGIIIPGTHFGRTVIIECKDVNRNNLPFNTKYEGAGLTKSQLESLQKWVEYGVYTLVLWHRNGQVGKMEGEEIVKHWTEGNKSYPWSLMTIVKNYDFLGAM